MSTNLHRDLAPVSSAAWQEIEEEARRTFTRNVAGRRVVDVPTPHGLDFASLSTGHYTATQTGVEDVRGRRRTALPVVELRTRFTVDREQVDSVDRGAADADWQSVKDAATRIARAEDGILFRGLSADGIEGIIPASSNAAIPLPADVRQFPDVVAQATSALRLVGVDGPYVLFLPAETYTQVAETVDDGYPIREHLQRLLKDGQIIWAPALDQPVLISDRGGDYELHLGQDLSIGYLHHDDETVTLYLQETLTVRIATAEASVVLGDPA